MVTCGCSGIRGPEIREVRVAADTFAGVNASPLKIQQIFGTGQMRDSADVVCFFIFLPSTVSLTLYICCFK